MLKDFGKLAAEIGKMAAGTALGIIGANVTMKGGKAVANGVRNAVSNRKNGDKAPARRRA